MKEIRQRAIADREADLEAEARADEERWEQLRASRLREWEDWQMGRTSESAQQFARA